MTNSTVTGPKGFRATGATCGLKASGRPDIGLLVSDVVCVAAGVFTQNKFCGAPIVVARDHVADGQLRAVVVNAGNANVATGKQGLRDAAAMCKQVAKWLDIPFEQVLPASTGVIGVPMPMDKVLPGIGRAAAQLSDETRGGLSFAEAIMTTDKVLKQASRTVKLGEVKVRLAGCLKGAGMIAPNMATTLSYITTDAAITGAALRKALKAATELTLNRVTIDECTSTSDMCVVLASGLAKNEPIKSLTSPGGKTFAKALLEICEDLAYQMAADGEGATRAIEVRVKRAGSARDAHKVARAIATSPLLKAAINGNDPNWGRIIQSVGAADAKFAPEKVAVTFGGQTIFSKGQPNRKMSVAKLEAAVKQPCVKIEVDLGAGAYADRVLTCDLSEEYVRFNGDYTT